MIATDLALVSHLLRRAGFGANRKEVEVYAEKEYEVIGYWLLVIGIGYWYWYWLLVLVIGIGNMN